MKKIFTTKPLMKWLAAAHQAKPEAPLLAYSPGHLEAQPEKQALGASDKSTPEITCIHPATIPLTSEVPVAMPSIVTPHKVQHPPSSDPTGPEFGLFFDIDGVIVRGGIPLPHSRDAFRLLTDNNGKFWVPSIFVTNAGNCLRQSKASQLRDWLGVDVDADQVIMSHSPLKMFRQFLDKHILVSGQGPTKEIAKYLGFTKVTTMETLRHCFPQLDMVDHKRRRTAPCAFEKYFPRIEAVIMFGEPVRWETNLQLIVDVLLTNGMPNADAPESIPYPHIPILACNVDLMWMAEAPMPRFGHGCFLHCLESLYNKISGYDLKYTALVGKPSELTYHHSEQVLQLQARNLGLEGIKRMYCIGDNPDIDIYGANLFNRYLQKMTAKKAARRHKVAAATPSANPSLSHGPGYLPEDHVAETGEDEEDELQDCTSCESILVSTGVYSSNRDYASNNTKIILNHTHRDFIMDPELRKPTLEVQNVMEAVEAIFRKEGIIS